MTLDRESDLNDKNLAGDVMDSEVDSLGGWTSNSAVDAGNDRMLGGSGDRILDRNISALYET